MSLVKETFLLLMLRFYLMLVLWTCKWKTYNFEVFENATQQKNPIMLSCWHENLVYFCCFFRFWKKNIHVISSTHRDSKILANILRRWGFKLIEGSSTRGWFSVLKELLIIFKTKKSIVAVTHDGPKGPPKKSKPGALKAAMQNNVCIIGMSAESNKYWRARSWDKTFLPKPFATIKVYFYPKYQGDSSDASLNKYLNKNEERSKS